MTEISEQLALREIIQLMFPLVVTGCPGWAFGAVLEIFQTARRCDLIE